MNFATYRSRIYVKMFGALVFGAFLDLAQCSPHGTRMAKGTSAQLNFN